MTTTTHAAESGHWYDRQGNPVWEVTGSKGQPVKPDVRHARKLGLVPGITSIIGSARKPALEIWQQEQAILAALTLPRGVNEPEDDWVRRVKGDAKEHAIQAAQRGTLIHAAVQGYFTDGSAESGFQGWIQTVADVTAELGGGTWIPEHACSHQLGFGTKADLHNDRWLIDFKTKDKLSPDQKLYDEHHMQLAATAAALNKPDLKCGIMFLDREDPSKHLLLPVKDDDLVRGWQMFVALLSFWKAKNRHDGGWSE